MPSCHPLPGYVVVAAAPVRYDAARAERTPSAPEGESMKSSKRELTELLEGVALFSKCTDRERRTIARHCETASLPTGSDLVVEGEPGDALFLILDGEAIVMREGSEVNRVGEGSYFGEL